MSGILRGAKGAIGWPLPWSWPWCPFKSFPKSIKKIHWKWPFQNKNGLALSRLKFQDWQYSKLFLNKLIRNCAKLHHSFSSPNIQTKPCLKNHTCSPGPCAWTTNAFNNIQTFLQKRNSALCKITSLFFSSHSNQNQAHPKLHHNYLKPLDAPISFYTANKHNNHCAKLQHYCCFCSDKKTKTS